MFLGGVKLHSVISNDCIAIGEILSSGNMQDLSTSVFEMTNTVIFLIFFGLIPRINIKQTTLRYHKELLCSYNNYGEFNEVFYIINNRYFHIGGGE